MSNFYALVQTFPPTQLRSDNIFKTAAFLMIDVGIFCPAGTATGYPFLVFFELFSTQIQVSQIFLMIRTI